MILDVLELPCVRTSTNARFNEVLPRAKLLYGGTAEKTRVEEGAAPKTDMRRDVIYPHRSIRSLDLTPERILAAIVLALALSIVLYGARGQLLFEHNRI